MPITQQNRRRTALIQLIVGGFVFALGGLLVAIIDNNATASAFWRMLFSGVVFLMLCLLKQQKTVRRSLIARLYLPRSVLFAVFWAALFLMVDLYFWHQSIYRIGPGIATILLSVQVFFSLLIGIFYLHEKTSRQLPLYALIALGGIGLLSLQEARQSEQGLIGIGAGIVSALGFALSLFFLHQAQHPRYHAAGNPVSLMVIMFYLSVFGVLITGVYALLSGDSLAIDNAKTFYGLLVYGVVIHVLAWYLIAAALSHLPLAITGLVLLLEPVATLVLDVVLLGKQLFVAQIVGTVLVLIAVYLGSKKPKAVFESPANAL